MKRKLANKGTSKSILKRWIFPFSGGELHVLGYDCYWKKKLMSTWHKVKLLCIVTEKWREKKASSIFEGKRRFGTGGIEERGPKLFGRRKKKKKVGKQILSK